MFDQKIYEDKMKKSISVFEEELETVRAGRANASVLSHVTVEYYGVPTPLSQVAEVKVTDARTITVKPWDPSLMKPAEKALQAADLGAFPQNDGQVLRLSFPPLTEDRRKELTKQVSKMGEGAKVNVRNIRRDANEKIKDAKKKGELTEDDQKNAEKRVQDLTDRYIAEIDRLVTKKSADIMEL